MTFIFQYIPIKCIFFSDIHGTNFKISYGTWKISSNKIENLLINSK